MGQSCCTSDDPNEHLPYQQQDTIIYIDGREAYRWVSRSAGRPLPETAIRGGRDQDGSEIYVGRAFHEGDMIPAKIIPAKGIAFVCWNGQEHPKDEYEVRFITSNTTGVLETESYYRHLPIFYPHSNSSTRRRHSDRLLLYRPEGQNRNVLPTILSTVDQAIADKGLSLGKMSVLCQGEFAWEFCSAGSIPPDGVVAGQTADGEPLYVGRVLHKGSQTIGKVQASHGCLYIPFDGEELSFTDYEVLVLH